jgi:hypothetical protein
MQSADAPPVEYTEAVNVKQLAQVANLDPRQMKEVLKTLVKIGLFVRRPTGATFAYGLNWDGVDAIPYEGPRRIKQPARTARVEGPQLMAAKTAVKEPESEPELETVEAVVQCPGCGLVFPADLVEIDGVLMSENLEPIAAARGGPTPDFHPPGKEAFSENPAVQFQQLNTVKVNSSSPQENAVVPLPERGPVGRSWEAVKTRLADKLTLDVFNNWVARTREVGHTNGVLMVLVPDKATEDWLTDEYGDQVREAMLAEGLTARVEYVVPAAAVPAPAEKAAPTEDDSKAAMVKWLEETVPSDTVGRGLTTWQIETLWKLKRQIGRRKFCDAVLAKVRSGYPITSWGLVIQVVDDAARIMRERAHE